MRVTPLGGRAGQWGEHELRIPDRRSVTVVLRTSRTSRLRASTAALVKWGAVGLARAQERAAIHIIGSLVFKVFSSASSYLILSTTCDFWHIIN